MKLWPWSVDIEPEAQGCHEKTLLHRVQFVAKCQETTRHYARLESVMATTCFKTGVSWHFCLFKDIRKIEL